MVENVDPQVQTQGVKTQPSLPPDAPEVILSDNALEVFKRRYIRKGEDGEPAETKEETFWRVAYNIAVVEETWGGNVSETADRFYR